MALKDDVLRRQRRIFLAFAVARGLVFWYAIEKLFEISIGLSTQQIVTLGIVAQGSKLILEIPSSAIADRWSRRNILIGAALAMILCCIILGLSNSMIIYLIGILFWSLSDALSSGVYEAFIYDSFGPKTSKRQMAKIYARLFTVFIVVLGVAGITGGIIGEYASLRLTIWLTIVPMAICILLLLRLPEPDVHSTADEGMSWMRHLGSSLQLLIKPNIRWPALVYISLYSLTVIWYEFYQLVGIELHMTPLVLSCIMAVMTAGMALGSELSHKFEASKLSVGIVWGILSLATVAGLRSGIIVVAMLNIGVLFMTMRMMQIYLELYLHGQLDSNKRATTLSLASSLAYGLFFALAAIYAFVLDGNGARWAFTVASLPLIGLIIVDVLSGLRWAARSQHVKPDTVLGKID